jgi:hypothetical protein
MILNDEEMNVRLEQKMSLNFKSLKLIIASNFTLKIDVDQRLYTAVGAEMRLYISIHGYCAHVDARR